VQLLPDLIETQTDERVLLGELGERGMQRAAVLRVWHDDGLERGRREVALVAASASFPDRVADPDPTQPPDLGDFAADGTGSADCRTALEHLDTRHRVVAHTVTHAERAAEQPHVGNPLASRTSVDLEDRARERAVRSTPGGGHQLGDPLGEGVDTCAGDRRAEEHRVHLRPLRLLHKRPAQPLVAGRRLTYERRQHAVVVVGHRCEVELRRAERHEVGGAGAETSRRAHRHEGRCQPVGDRPQQGALLCADKVDLVDEQQGREAESLQAAHEDARLRLDALECGDHQHRPVEDAERTLDLGDEVRVTGRVEQVDGDVADHERHHRGLDRDAAPTFDVEEVGVAGPSVDAADLVDDARSVEQTFGQSGLTGVDVGKDP
jgi:hypothetical protein